jgi:hypothetical protein
METSNNLENLAFQFQHIPGWNVDADPENEPTYPYKHYTGDDHKRLNWERPIQQEAKVEVLHSNERPNLSATFGTVSPPSGLSGVIRRKAFKFSESEYGHWLNLLLADRINVVEGFIDDIMHGHVPNIFAEKGMKADWNYNKTLFFKRVAITAAITVGVVALFNQKKIKRAFQ